MGISVSTKSSNPEKKRRCKGMMIRASLFGVGAPEALVIGVAALLVFGPKGLVEISGPPEFLNNRTEADEEASARDAEHAKRISRKKKKVKPKGVVMEVKPQLVGIHERVRNDIDAPPSSMSGEKRISTATNPNAEESIDLLRICWR